MGGSIKGCMNENKLAIYCICTALSGCSTHTGSHTSSESLRVYAVSCAILTRVDGKREQMLACLSFGKQWWGQERTGSSSRWCIQLSDPTLEHNPCEEPREKIKSALELQTSDLCHTVFYCDTGRGLVIIIAPVHPVTNCGIVVVVGVNPLLCSDNWFCCRLYQEPLLTEPFLLRLPGDFICSALLSWTLTDAERKLPPLPVTNVSHGDLCWKMHIFPPNQINLFVCASRFCRNPFFRLLCATILQMEIF